MPTHYIAIEKGAQMPMSCWGQYRRVGVVEVSTNHDETDIPMLSERCRNVVRIVETWEDRNLTRKYSTAAEAATDGSKCAAALAWAEAESVAEALNQ